MDCRARQRLQTRMSEIVMGRELDTEIAAVIGDLTLPLRGGLYFTPLIARYLRMRLA